MFGNKKKLILTYEEKRLIFYALNEFRNDLLNKKEYTDLVDEMMIKLKEKMKVTEDDLGVLVNVLYKTRQDLADKNGDTSFIDDLILKLIGLKKTFIK